MCHPEGGGRHDQCPVALRVCGASGPNPGTATDFEGAYRLEGVPAGVHNVVVSFSATPLKPSSKSKPLPARPAVVNVALNEAAIAVDAAEVVVESRATVEEALERSKHRHQRNQAQPGRGTTSVGHCARCRAWRPSRVSGMTLSFAAVHENRFYLDGIEIPNINHFAARAADRWG